MARKGRHHSRRTDSISSSSSHDSYASDRDSLDGRKGAAASSSRSRHHRRRASRDYAASRPSSSRHRRHRSSGSYHSRSRSHYDSEPPMAHHNARPPKVAMTLLLGPDEVEFTLTESQILYDSPNDLSKLRVCHAYVCVDILSSQLRHIMLTTANKPSEGQTGQPYSRTTSTDIAAWQDVPHARSRCSHLRNYTSVHE